MEILGLDGDSLGVDGGQVGVLEQGNEVSLGGFLESGDGGGLESEISLEVLGDFSDQSLEGEFSDEELGRFLVSPDLSEGDGTGPVPVGLLDTTGSGTSRLGCGLSGSLGGELLSGSLSSGGLSCGLLSSCHCVRLGVALQKSKVVGEE